MTTVTALIPVYAGAEASHLDQALASIRRQTCPADEVVIVCDGPLGADLEAVLSLMDEARIVRLHTHRGLGVALRVGVEVAASRWIARCDADDVSVPTRFEVQLARASVGDVDAIGSSMIEFRADGSVTGLREMPLAHSDVRKAMLWNNSLNHPTMFLNRAAVLAAGNYRDVPSLEDYDLWVRMLSAGSQIVNLPHPLVRFRADDHLARRRLTPTVFRSELVVQREVRRAGLSRTRVTLFARIVLRLGFRVLPRRLMAFAYTRIFLKAVSGSKA